MTFSALFLVSTELLATDCSVKMAGRAAASGSSICFASGDYPTDSHIEAAADRWNNNCDGGGTMPSLNVGSCTGASVTISVVYQAGTSTNSLRTCGLFQASTSGALTGGTITIYEYGQYLTGLQAGNTYLCAPQASDTIAHEIGHVLGLDNAPDVAACYGHIMGARMGEDRDIAADDCAQVNALWNTPAEQQASCDMHCWTSCDGGDCPRQPVTALPNPCPYSPILIDLDYDGFNLVGAADAVTFDIDGDGQPNRIAWTAAGTEDAFLTFDRNGNGMIDNGRELFGNFTRLASGEAAPNGYEALIEFDDPAFGGNGDEIISPADAGWGLLKVWIDRNHDGASDAGELVGLNAAGIAQFDTRYKRSNKSDQHGNLFRFKSRALVRSAGGRLRPSITYDVFFAVAD